MDFVTVSTGLILPYWMGLPIRYIHYDNQHEALAYLLMAKKLLEKKVELALVTDHNTFSGFTKLENAIAFLHRHHKNKFKTYTNLLLGIEISCADSHVVGIFDYEQNYLEERIDGLHMTEKWCACSAPSVYL